MGLLCSLLTVVILVIYNNIGTTSVYALQAPSEITVAAAISLKDVFREIGQIYELRTGTKVNFNSSASGILQKQIEGGAPVDVFASAGEKQMNKLEAKGLIVQESRRDFGRNVLVLVAPIDSQLNILSFNDLDNPKLKRLAIADPKTVPARQYTQQLLANMKLWEKVQPQRILSENVRQALDYVVRGEVDTGIVSMPPMFLSPRVR